MTGGHAGGWSLPLPDGFRLAPTAHSHGAVRLPPFGWDDERRVLGRVLRTGSQGDAARPVEVGEETAERIEIRRGAGGARPEEIRTLALGIRTPGWEPDDDARVEVEEAWVFMLDLARNLRPFHDLCREDRALRRIPEIGAGRLLRCPTLWEELGKAVLAGRLPWARAVEATGAVTRLGEPVPGADGPGAWPSPAEVTAADEEGLRALGVPEREARELVALARRTAGGELDLAPAQAGTLTPDAFQDLILSVDGLDEDASDRLLILYGHTDRLPLDPATVELLRDIHFGGRTPSLADVRARYEPFGEWRGLACWLEVAQALWWPRAGIPS